MVERALSEVKAMVLTQEAAGAYYAKMLADYGARVLKIVEG